MIDSDTVYVGNLFDEGFDSSDYIQKNMNDIHTDEIMSLVTESSSANDESECTFGCIGRALQAQPKILTSFVCFVLKIWSRNIFGKTIQKYQPKSFQNFLSNTKYVWNSVQKTQK